MKDATLLGMSKRNLQTAELLIDTKDEGLLPLAAFHLHQTAELFMKHFLELSGVPYHSTPLIKSIYAQCVKEGVVLPVGSEIILRISDVLTDFGVHARYSKNFNTPYSSIVYCRDELKRLIDPCDAAPCKSWSVCKYVSAPYLNVERIFPLKQAAVEAAVTACKSRADITELVVFGSSLRADCNPWDDVDLYVVGASKHVSPIRLLYGDSVFDIRYSSDTEMVEGVTVYQK